jgi:hypothetical protein
MPMNKPMARPQQQPMQQQYMPQPSQSNQYQQSSLFVNMEPIQQQQRPAARPAPRPQPMAPAPIDEYHEPATFEPLAPSAPIQQAPEQQQDDYYSYGSINLEPMTNQQQNSMMGQNEGFATFDQAAVPPQSQSEFDPSSGKTDLDMEIERYQREIEEKQRRGGRSSAPAPQQPPSGYTPSQPQQQMQQPQQQQNIPYSAAPPSTAAQHQDYDVYNMEIPSYGSQPQQGGQPMLGSGEEEEMFFTSVDTDRLKKPLKRPINPRTQPQQKGFLSKFFNKDMPG